MSNVICIRCRRPNSNIPHNEHCPIGQFQAEIEAAWEQQTKSTSAKLDNLLVTQAEKPSDKPKNPVE